MMGYRLRRLLLCGALALGTFSYAIPVSAAPLSASATASSATTSSSLPSDATVPAGDTGFPTASSWVLVDSDTGNVLDSYKGDEDLSPASLSKVLTALIAITYLSPTDTIPVTAKAASAEQDDVGMEVGSNWNMSDTLHSLLVYSANDAAYALAIRIAGSLAGFSTIMNHTATQLGLRDNPIFKDPSGLDDSQSFEGGNSASAHDLAILGRDLLSSTELTSISGLKTYDFTDQTGVSHHLVSTNYTFLNGYVGSVGIKTGYTKRAGMCVMGAATRNGRTMLAVVMNGYNPTATAEDLLDKGFSTPVSSEPTADQLPAVRLPSPPPMKPVTSPGSGHKGTHSGHNAGSNNRLESLGAGERPAVSPSGLSRVASSLPGLALIILSFTSGFWLIAELRKTALSARRRRGIIHLPYRRY